MSKKRGRDRRVDIAAINKSGEYQGRMKMEEFCGLNTSICGKECVVVGGSGVFSLM